MNLHYLTFTYAVRPKIDENTATDFNISVIVDRPLVIECPAFGNPQPTIVWYKDGVEIVTDYNPGIRILSGGRRLEIASADTSDAGRYACVAKNPAGVADREYILNVWSKLQEYQQNCQFVYLI